MKLIFFNHKGGVSKTTTAYNLGWMLGILGKRTLLVDADPQCNLTSLILGDSFDDYYTQDDTKYQNIKDGVKVAFEGKPAPIEAVTCHSPIANRNIFLLAGHPNLSEYDASLSFAQTSNNAITTLQNLPGAFNELIKKTAEAYEIEYTLIDLNPGLSAINQNLFISSDAFIIPTNPDPFSIMALNSLSSILPRWVEWSDRMRPLFQDASYQLSDSRPKFIGEIIQRFNIRKGGATRQAQVPIAGIKDEVITSLIPKLRDHNMLFSDDVYRDAGINADFCIAEIPDFQGIIHKSYARGVPVFALSDAQIRDPTSVSENPTVGTVLDTYKTMRDSFYQDFQRIARQIIIIKEHATGI
ncbi:MAG: AAA family ATPase [Dyadobacter sp.]|uniref:ParA family protein n=1 Tax=Dyadobacter sp. TaxID=1914288 RepID=UPI003267F000